MSGRVYLVGAGPGDPGLLTARALELIARADVILYDRLIPASALDGARADAELLFVGKEGGGPSVEQEQLEDVPALPGQPGAAGRGMPAAPGVGLRRRGDPGAGTGPAPAGGGEHADRGRADRGQADRGQGADALVLHCGPLVVPACSAVTTSGQAAWYAFWVHSRPRPISDSVASAARSTRKSSSLRSTGEKSDRT